MSGFEVAGIVLGSIPIVVSALECYMKGLGTLQNFRSYKRILKGLILTLKTEHVQLQNICEKLLIGIAPQARIEEMIRDPFGDLWREKEIFNKLRLRLWNSLQVFDARVQDMKEAIEEMMKKLNIGTGANVGSCLHDVGLKLTPPSRTVVPDDGDEDIIKELQFRLAVSYLASTQRDALKQWNEILLRSGEDSKTATVSFTQSTTLSRKTVGFSIPSTSSANGQQSTQTVTVQSSMANLTLNTHQTISAPTSSQHINNLCEAMKTMERRNKERNADTFNTSKLIIPLKQVLQDPAMLYGDQLRLAWMISCGVLQMQGTPWVTGIPRSEDIYIAEKQGVHQFQHVFVLRHFPEYPKRDMPSPTNPFMLHLGILLIELILGQSIANLDSAQNQALESGLPRHVLDYEAANKLLGRVMMTGGSGYYNAVERYIAEMDQELLSRDEGAQQFMISEDGRRIDYENQLLLDITHLTVKSAALKIYEHIVGLTGDECETPAIPAIPATPAEADEPEGSESVNSEGADAVVGH
ncbi:hypothetical protein F53441_6008 [Fusarium austroafricanum]|uniref:DUF7580 domain-containing protein n=1 Tax=Fusarium austroafricanum TaxID=2364996 RepID=A0A8H4P7L4_9HYPO|nr:hypothetical protein F53441_6008 [Fusarium austroafricanum]